MSNNIDINYQPPVNHFNVQYNYQEQDLPPPYQEPQQPLPQYGPNTFLNGRTKMPRQEFYQQLDTLKFPKYYGHKVQDLTGLALGGAVFAATTLGILLLMVIAAGPSTMFSMPDIAGIMFGMFGGSGVAGLVVAAVGGVKLYRHQTKKIDKDKIQKVLNEIVECQKNKVAAAEKKLAQQIKFTENQVNLHTMLTTYVKTTKV